MHLLRVLQGGITDAAAWSARPGQRLGAVGAERGMGQQRQALWLNIAAAFGAQSIAACLDTGQGCLDLGHFVLVLQANPLEHLVTFAFNGQFAPVGVVMGV